MKDQFIISPNRIKLNPDAQQIVDFIVSTNASCFKTISNKWKVITQYSEVEHPSLAVAIRISMNDLLEERIVGDKKATFKGIKQYLNL